MSDISMLAVTQGVGAFQSFLPRLETIRKGDSDDAELVSVVRTGEFAGAAITLAIGILASSLSGDSKPTILALVISDVMLYVYETALRKEKING